MTNRYGSEEVQEGERDPKNLANTKDSKESLTVIIVCSYL